MAAVVTTPRDRHAGRWSAAGPHARPGRREGPALVWRSNINQPSTSQYAFGYSTARLVDRYRWRTMLVPAHHLLSSERKPPLNQQSHDITAAFLQAHHDLLAFVECCGAEHWQAICPDEGRAVGVLLHHVAIGYAVETDLIKAVASGQPLPAIYSDWAEVDRINAAHAERHHDCCKQETVALLQQHAAVTLEYVRGLSEAQLCRTAHIPLLAPWFGDAVSARQLIEGLLLAHIQMHLAGMKAATGIA